MSHRYPHRRLLAACLIACASPIVLSFSGLGHPALGEEMRLEAEDYSSSWNTGDSVITVVECSEASGGHAVEGVDVLGEWISWRVTFAERFCFVDSLRSAGGKGFVREFAILYEPDPPTTTTAGDTASSPPGEGIG